MDSERQYVIPKPELVSQPNAVRITALAFNPDGKILVSGSLDGTIKIWDVKTGELLFTLHGHKKAVTTIAFSPDGKTMASGSRDFSIIIWDWDKKGIRRIIEDAHSNGGGVVHVAFSPDSKKIVSSGACYGEIHVWDVVTGELLLDLYNIPGYIPTVIFSPDGGKIVAGSCIEYDEGAVDCYKGVIVFLSSKTGIIIRKITAHKGLVLSVAYSTDGKTFISASDDSTIKFWNTRTGKLLKTLNFTGLTKSLTISPDAKALALVGYDKIFNNRFELRNLRTGKIISKIPVNYYSAIDYYFLDYIFSVFNPDMKTIATSGVDNVIRIWRVEDGKLIFFIPQPLK